MQSCDSWHVVIEDTPKLIALLLNPNLCLSGAQEEGVGKAEGDDGAGEGGAAVVVGKENHANTFNQSMY